MCASNKKVAYLWINKDAANLQSQDHLTVVNSHAQKNRVRRAKNAGSKPSSTSVPRARFPWSHRQNPNSVETARSTTHCATPLVRIAPTYVSKSQRPSTRVNEQPIAAAEGAFYESGVEEVTATHRSHRLTNHTSGENVAVPYIDDTFSDLGDLRVPYIQYYPCKATAARLPFILDYYIKSCGPTLVLRRDSFKRDFFQLSMREPIIFESAVASAQSRLDLIADPDSQPSTAFLYHQGRVLKMLHERIQSNSSTTSMDDTTVFVLMAMITRVVAFSDWEAFPAHMKFLRNLISLRGGVEKLGWYGWFRGVILWADMRWAGHRARLTSNEEDSNAGNLKEPSYPNHPFPPSVCLVISRLPEGFRDAALSTSLSIEVLSLLEQVQTWVEESVFGVQGVLAYWQKVYSLVLGISETLRTYSFSSIERLTCMGVIAYALGSDPSVNDGRLARGLDDFMTGAESLCCDCPPCETLLWASVAIAASTDGGLGSRIKSKKWMVLDRYLLASDLEVRDWTDARQILRKFFWKDSLESRWEACWHAAVERTNSDDHQ